MKVKRYWKNTWEYKRILELLDFYWLQNPDEMSVVCELEFVKANGESTRKRIIWSNPNSHVEGNRSPEGWTFG